MKVRRPGQYRVPYDRAGNLMHYASERYASESPGQVDWRANEPFHADLQLLDEMGTGRSAKYLWWRDVATGLRYPMFVVDLVDLVRHGAIEYGQVLDDWAVRKRGTNYGLINWRPE